MIGIDQTGGYVRTPTCLGLLRIRNEGLILAETLDHMAAICSLGIVVFDDASTDASAIIAESHPAVVRVIRQREHLASRAIEEWRNKQIMLDYGRKLEPEWFLTMDADERLEFNWDDIPDDADSVEMRLFDAYITTEDQHLVGTNRRWFGPEHRDILFLFRNQPQMAFFMPVQRIVAGAKNTVRLGHVKHFGKALSVELWEDKCRYYVENYPRYAEKWQSRMGKAIHETSDWGRPLLLWEDVKGSEDFGLDHYDSPPPLSPEMCRQMALARRSEYLCPACGGQLNVCVYPPVITCVACGRGIMEFDSGD